MGEEGYLCPPGASLPLPKTQGRRSLFDFQSVISHRSSGGRENDEGIKTLFTSQSF